MALPVVKAFIERVKERALGEEVGKSLTPGQQFVKIIHGELVQILGAESVPLDLRAQPPVVVMLAVLIGGTAFGFTGMILAVPTSGCCRP
mgnify:CR=1 FL=1